MKNNYAGDNDKSREAFDEVMREIRAGLTGEAEKDVAYMLEQIKAHVHHPLATEIVKECCRELYDMLDPAKRDELEKALADDLDMIPASLDKVRALIRRRDPDGALKALRPIVDMVEALDWFRDDAVSEYRIFTEAFEVSLYRYRNKPKRTLRKPGFPFEEIYMLCGTQLVEKRRFGDAREALEKGLRWSPLDISLMTEYVETYKMEGDMDRFFEKNLELHRIAYSAPAVARFYRNIGYWFIEKKLYREAFTAYLVSLGYEESQNALREMDAIVHFAGEMKKPTPKYWESLAKKYGFPAGPDSEIVELAVGLGHYYREEGDATLSRYYFAVAYGLTHDEALGKMIEENGKDENGKGE